MCEMPHTCSGRVAALPMSSPAIGITGEGRAAVFGQIELMERGVCGLSLTRSTSPKCPAGF